MSGKNKKKAGASSQGGAETSKKASSAKPPTSEKPKLISFKEIEKKAKAPASLTGNGRAVYDRDKSDTRPKMIEIVDFTKVYSDLVAVDNITLDVRAGELFCVLGPNGAGKTTTIKTLVGLLRPTQGVLRVGGYDIQTHPVEAKRIMGYIPDHPYLYEKLSGRDMFRFVADLFGVDWEVAQERMEYYFDLFKLQRAKDTLVENYSHGMRQKLCFSLALMHRPDVIIVDEPMVGLDPESARVVKNLMRQECERGACVFLSTHTLPLVEEIADRLAIYKRGKVIFQGSVEELRNHQNMSERLEHTLEDLFLELTQEGEEPIRI